MLQNYADYESKRNEVIGYSKALQEKLDKKFVSKLSPCTPLTDVWRWVNTTERTQPKNPLGTLCLERGISIEDAVNNLLQSQIASGAGSGNSTTAEEYTPTDRSISVRLSLPFNRLELNAALSAADARSAAGPDGISNKLLKSLGEEGNDALLLYMNQVLQSGNYPEDWKLGEGTPILKQGRPKGELSSYRVILKCSHTGKLLELMLLRRLMAVVEENACL